MNRKIIYYWLLLPVLALMMGACSKTDDVEESSETDFVEVPGIEEDAWVSADNISDDDLTLFIDFMVKIDYMRVQYIKMLSNNFEGDKLFSGLGDKTDPNPTMRTYTAFMVNADNYLAAIERLDAAGLMTPATRTSNIGNAKKIVNASRKENERALITIQDNLTELSKIGKYDNKAQQELYDYYKELEPDNAKAIGAKDARDFFQKLNNGELTNYAANIRNILCYTPPLDEKRYEHVGDLNSVSFTGENEQLKSGLRVSSEVYVAATELYFTGIDKLAGSYGAKIMEYSDLVDDRLKLLKIAKKAVQGKTDWQEVNSYIVNRYADQIKGAVKEVLGEDLGGLTKELMEDAVDKIAEDITEQLVAESASEADPTTENGKKQIENLVEDVDMAVLHIYADPGKMTTRPKLIIITDDVTGKVTMVCPNEQGDAIVATTPGRKTITYLDGDGNRLTKKVTLEEGYNRLDVRNMVTLKLEPGKVEMQAKGGLAKVDMLSNCRYYRYRFEEPKPDWIRVSRTGHTLNITVDENNSDQPRSYKFIAEVSRDKYKVAAKAIVEVNQEGQKGNKEKIEASPTPLTFEAEGGQQTVKVDKKSYLYCGGFTDSDCEDWVTIVNGSDDTFTVTAAPNTTDKERTGTIYAFATNTTNPTADDIELLPIKVTQKAGTVKEGWVLVNTEVIKHENTSGDRGQYMNYSASATELSNEGKVIGRVGPYRDVDKLFDLGFVATIQAPPTTLNAGETLRLHITVKRTTKATIDTDFRNQIALYSYPGVEMWWNIYNSSGYFGVENLEGPSGGPSSYSTENTSSWDYVYRVPSGRKDKEESVYWTACGSKVIWTYRWGGTSD